LLLIPIFRTWSAALPVMFQPTSGNQAFTNGSGDVSLPWSSVRSVGKSARPLQRRPPVAQFFLFLGDHSVFPGLEGTVIERRTQPIEPALVTLLRPVARNELRDVTSIARAQTRNGRPERIVFLECPRTSRDAGRHPNSFQVGLAARWGIWGHRDE
jgi:hypothetical protein